MSSKLRDEKAFLTGREKIFEMQPLDFEEYLQFKGIEVKNYQDLEPKIKEAMEHNGPVLVNIYTDSDTLAMPPKITFEQMRGFATTMVKKIGLGKFNEVENMVKAGIDTL